MATFTDIVKSQRKSGSGVMSSLNTAFSERAKEKMDPRNYLFNRSGVLTALFPQLKGYQAQSKETTQKIKEGSTSGAFGVGQVDLIVSRLDSIGIQQQIQAKNSMVLPMMSRDINVMRQNIVKMVKLQGGTPATKADAFFMKSKDREAAYETQFGKKPTAIGATKAPEQEGLFSKLMGDLMRGGIIGMIMRVGGALLIAKAFESYANNPEFRESVNKGVKAIFGAIFDFMKEHWQGTLIALAALFPLTTLSLIGNGLKLLSGLLMGGTEGVGIVSALTSLSRLLLGPAGLVAAVGLLMWKITDWADKADMNNPDGNPFAILAKSAKEFSDWVNEKTGRDAVYADRRESNKKRDLQPGEFAPRGTQTEIKNDTVKNYENKFINAKDDATRAQILPGLNMVRKMAGLAELTMDQAKQNLLNSNAPSQQPAKQESGQVGRITGQFGENRGSHMHQGTDVAAPLGTAVTSTGAGKVTFSGVQKGYGNTIEVDHGDGLKSRYAHLKDLMASVGTEVTAGQQIGTVGNTGRSTGPHLHYELLKNGQAINSGSTALAALNPSQNTTGTQLAQNSADLANSQRGGNNININNSGNVVSASNDNKQESAPQLAPAEVMDTDLMRELFRKRVVSYA